MMAHLTPFMAYLLFLLAICIGLWLVVTFLPMSLPLDGEDMNDEKPTLDTRGPDDR